MNRILRSIIQVGGYPDADEALVNYQNLLNHTIDFEIEEDFKVFSYLKNFYAQMSSPPDFSLVKEHFEKLDDIETVARLEEIKTTVPQIRTNYLAIVRSTEEQQLQKNFILLCKEAQIIAEQGRNLEKPIQGKNVLRGVPDALGFLFDKLHNFTRIEGGEKLEGVISDDADEVIEEYEIIEKTDQYKDRNLIGLEPIDEVCRGHRKGELWTHCGFAGELKSTMAINYTYNNVMVYNKNIFYTILEMPYTQLRRQFYVLHSSHGKFITEWHRDGYVGLDYRKVRDGELSEKDKERLKIIAKDFEQSAKGKLFIWRPDSEVTLQDIRQKAEMFDNKYGCNGIVVDHLGLVQPKRHRSDYVVALNTVVRDSKLLALNFSRGKSIPVLALFQINRQGKLRADKNDGHYDFASIAYANEVERSSDVVTYTYLNDMLRHEGKFYLGNLKNRDNQIFDRLVGKIFWNTKRMRALISELSNTMIDEDRAMELQELAKQPRLSVEDMYSEIAVAI